MCQLFHLHNHPIRFFTSTMEIAVSSNKYQTYDFEQRLTDYSPGAKFSPPPVFVRLVSPKGFHSFNVWGRACGNLFSSMLHKYLHSVLGFAFCLAGPEILAVCPSKKSLLPLTPECHFPACYTRKMVVCKIILGGSSMIF